MYNTFKALSVQEAANTKTVGRDREKWGSLRLDNVQQYSIVRDLRIGRENKMITGIAATYIETYQYCPQDSDLDHKRNRLAEKKRLSFTTSAAEALLDQAHAQVVGVLSWIGSIIDYALQLVTEKPHLATLYRTRAAIQIIPPHKDKVHPLGTSSKVETIPTELKDALLDFFAQMGQVAHDYLRRLLPVGGDGLTYEKLLQLKAFMQFHEDEFESFELLEPILELWHTKWTDLSRIYEMHWGYPLSKNPATLGHSAAKIG
ncbi:hypothetical protein Hypma_010673 [Hypsizygus marmoreus]|uniref:DUF6589 domain-containing protein n=1 Tax=Hypsizygus marmoreus TaxID=39966 RepID=A0A369JLN6_HYPMA|nr:hypothetical protein Hypma_010673 [Hypsizygus marmoreus]